MTKGDIDDINRLIVRPKVDSFCYFVLVFEYSNKYELMCDWKYENKLKSSVDSCFCKDFILVLEGISHSHDLQ